MGMQVRGVMLKVMVMVMVMVLNSAYSLLIVLPCITEVR